MECVYVLQRFYKVPREAVVTQLTGLLAYKGLDRDNLELYQASLVVYARTTRDFVECILCAREKSGQGIVFSFGGKLNRLLSQNGNGV
jgi:predicted nucleic-acid-binding protein